MPRILFKEKGTVVDKSVPIPRAHDNIRLIIIYLIRAFENNHCNTSKHKVLHTLIFLLTFPFHIEWPTLLPSSNCKPKSVPSS